MHVLGHSLLMRLLTVPHCLIQQHEWLCSGKKSRLHSVAVLNTLSLQSCCTKFVVVACSCHLRNAPAVMSNGYTMQFKFSAAQCNLLGSFQQFLCGFPFINKAGVLQGRFSLCAVLIHNTECRVSQGSCVSVMVVVECTNKQVEFSIHGKSTRYWRGMCFNINRLLQHPLFETLPSTLLYSCPLFVQISTCFSLDLCNLSCSLQQFRHMDLYLLGWPY